MFHCVLLPVMVTVMVVRAQERGFTVTTFNPLLPVLGKVPKRGETYVRVLVHDVAFMLRAMRTVVKDHRETRDPAPLTHRFPTVPVPEDYKVRHHCQQNFILCVAHLSRVARRLGLSARHDHPTRRLASRQGLCVPRSSSARVFCPPKAFHSSGVLSNYVYKTPLEQHERYVQIVTALQYMCWYSMHGVPYLANLVQCDSTDPNNLYPDGDFRASSAGDPFGCALHSFCPNPCCGGLLVPDEQQCSELHVNPCRLHGQRGGKGCVVFKEKNLNYYKLADQGVEHSCDCGRKRVYNLLLDKCLRQDPCEEPRAACPDPATRCLPLLDGHACMCGPALRWHPRRRRCLPLYSAPGEEYSPPKENKTSRFQWLDNLVDSSAFLSSMFGSPARGANKTWSLV